MNTNNIIIFTDLDGSLLDDNEYTYTLAKPLLTKLKEQCIPLVLNSSKTQMEIFKLHAQLELDSPYMIENGAAVIFDVASAQRYLPMHTGELKTIQNNRVKIFAQKRSYILKITNEIKKRHQLNYVGFDDLTIQQVSEMTHLDYEDAYAAKQRAFSEPIIWQDSQEQLTVFKNNLAHYQIETQIGGRFIHLGSHCSKGDAMNWLLHHWKFNQGAQRTVIAIGDSMNDISMLNAADYALVVKNNQEALPVKGKKQTIYSSKKGTAGWVEMLEPLLEQLTLKKGTSSV